MLSDKNWEMGKRQETHFFHQKMEPKNTRIRGIPFGRIYVVLWEPVQHLQYKKILLPSTLPSAGRVRFSIHFKRGKMAAVTQ